MQKVVWKQRELWLNDVLFISFEPDCVLEQAAFLYQHLGLSYPKFYKMDILCKVGYLCSELLLQVPSGTINLARTATYISTKDGCFDVDSKFLESTRTLASPALFVYTLPNIVLGEICIRHKFKGEQICYISPQIDKDDINFYLNDIFTRRGQEHCLCGHINVLENSADAELYWVDKAGFQSL